MGVECGEEDRSSNSVAMWLYTLCIFLHCLPCPQNLVSLEKLNILFFLTFSFASMPLYVYIILNNSLCLIIH